LKSYYHYYQLVLSLLLLLLLLFAEVVGVVEVDEVVDDDLAGEFDVS
jgi:hypothetical protein